MPLELRWSAKRHASIPSNHVLDEVLARTNDDDNTGSSIGNIDVNVAVPVAACVVVLIIVLAAIIIGRRLRKRGESMYGP